MLKAIQFDASNELLRKQVMQELKALHGGRHPNVVQYCGAFFVGGAITILMDYMAGGTLADLLAQVLLCAPAWGSKRASGLQQPP